MPVVSRSISFENPTGEKGIAGKTASTLGVGRKGAPCKFIFPGTINFMQYKRSGTFGLLLFN